MQFHQYTRPQATVHLKAAGVKNHLQRRDPKRATWKRTNELRKLLPLLSPFSSTIVYLDDLTVAKLFATTPSPSLSRAKPSNEIIAAVRALYERAFAVD